jgi:hypothetical protein
MTDNVALTGVSERTILNDGTPPVRKIDPI